MGSSYYYDFLKSELDFLFNADEETCVNIIKKFNTKLELVQLALGSCLVPCILKSPRLIELIDEKLEYLGYEEEDYDSFSKSEEYVPILQENPFNFPEEHLFNTIIQEAFRIRKNPMVVSSKFWFLGKYYKYYLMKIGKLKPSNNGKISTGLKCPCCNREIKATKKYYLCEKYKNGCTFILPKIFFGTSISEDSLKKLLNKQTISEEFTWKSGKKGKALLMLENGHYKFIFN